MASNQTTEQERHAVMAHLLVCVCLVSAVLAGCSPKPVVRPQPGAVSASSISAYAGLREQIDALLADSLFPPSNAGILIYSITRQEPLYELNPDLLFTPASNQKLLTAAAALQSLGAEYRFRTEVFVDSAAITVRGSGDPLLSLQDLDSLCSAILLRLDTSRSWLLRGDISLFDTTRWGKGWMWDDAPGTSVMPISPLSVNRNVISIELRAGAAPGDPVAAFAVPYTRFVRLENRLKTSAAAAEDTVVIRRHRSEGSNVFFIEGVVPTGTSLRRRVSVGNPEEFFLTMLSERLEKRGVLISGIQVGRFTVAHTPSFSFDRGLDTVLTYMNKQSDNLCAESLYRVIGYHETGHAASPSEASTALSEALAGVGIDTSGIVIADGSGVSRYNLLSASRIVGLLRVIHARPDYFRMIERSLSVAGVDGTLKNRMSGTPAQGNLRGKTGTFTGGSALSGYVESRDGELIAFSIIMQFYPVAAGTYRDVQDSIGVLLSRIERKQY